MDIVAVLARLNRFGSADAIAQHLADIGCRGVDGYNNQCPIARYVFAETGQLFRTTSTRVWRGLPGQVSSITTPVHISRFIDRFDNHVYPDLIVGPTSDEVWLDADVAQRAEVA